MYNNYIYGIFNQNNIQEQLRQQQLQQHHNEQVCKSIKVPFKMVGGERVDDTPVHKALMKMFNLINIGECAGSGVPNIFNVWADEGWEEPVIEERFDPDRTILSLSFLKKVTEKSDRKNTSPL